MSKEFKAGDGVTFTRYGVEIRATVVEDPNGSVLIVREHESGRRSWCHAESARKVGESI